MRKSVATKQHSGLSSRGFTLIELLVVISIIGILSVMGLIAINDAKESARDARRVSDLSQFRIALALYFDDYDAYPPTKNGVDADKSYNLVPVDGSIFSQVSNPLVPKYMSKYLLDPMNGPDFWYQYDTNENNSNKSYKLCFRKESVNYTWRVFYSDGVFSEASECTAMP